MYSLFVGFWPGLHIIYDKYLTNIYDNQEVKEKIVRNAISFTNCIGTMLFCMCYYITQNEILFNLLTIIPLMFYIYDTYFILNKKLVNEYNYIIHHILTIVYFEKVYLVYHQHRNELLTILFMLEISNIPIYLVYHMLQELKLEPDNIKLQNKLYTLKKIQLGIYGPLRIIYVPYFFHKHQELFPRSAELLAILFYMIGCYWFSNQCLHFIKNSKKNIKDIKDK
tara:strand:+ start:691 stop:1362 length:672 start_codon:yes stop_codon:yes gene_type:complete